DRRTQRDYLRLDCLDITIDLTRAEDALDEIYQRVANLACLIERRAQLFWRDRVRSLTQRLHVGLHGHQGGAQLMVHAGDELVFERIELLGALVGDAHLTESALECPGDRDHERGEEPLIDEGDRQEQWKLRVDDLLQSRRAWSQPEQQD